MSQDLQLLNLVRIAKKRNSDGSPTASAERAFKEISKILEPELRKMSSKLYIVGADINDVLQEGRLGVWKSVKDFNDEHKMSFKNFAIMCAKRNIITALTAARRKKFDLHNNSVSLDEPVIGGSDDESDQSLADFIRDDSKTTVEMMILQEEYLELSNRLLPQLTELEADVFIQYVRDQTYAEIADNLGIKAKSADNSLLRIRNKALYIRQEILESDAGDF